MSQGGYLLTLGNLFFSELVSVFLKWRPDTCCCPNINILTTNITMTTSTAAETVLEHMLYAEHLDKHFEYFLINIIYSSQCHG